MYIYHCTYHIWSMEWRHFFFLFSFLCFIHHIKINTIIHITYYGKFHFYYHYIYIYIYICLTSCILYDMKWQLGKFPFLFLFCALHFMILFSILAIFLHGIHFLWETICCILLWELFEFVSNLSWQVITNLTLAIITIIIMPPNTYIQMWVKTQDPHELGTFL